MEDGKVESSMLLGVLPATRSFSWLKPMYQFRPNSGGAATTISPWVGPSITSLLFRLTLLQAGAMSKRREQDQSQQHEDMGRTLHRVYAALYNNVPWLAVAAICMYLPGIVLWAVFALHCKADTFKFLTTIAPVDDSTVDGVSNLVNTTLIALITTATFIFMLALVLAIARSVQKAGAAPNSSFPCVRNSPSSFYLYRVFNLGYNFIVFFVNMFIIFLMMGAFLWLVVAYGANLSIKGGVLDAANIGARPQLQYDLAKANYTTVVSQYEQQLKLTPACVRNTTWLKGINSSINSILKPTATNNSSTGGNAMLCPQSCLNLGSWATLFKLKSNCICDQAKLFELQRHSLAVATDAGVALGGLILIYFGSCCMHTYLISEHVRAGYDYKRAKRQAVRRQQLNSSISGSDQHRNGHDKGPNGSGGSFGGGGGPNSRGNDGGYPDDSKAAPEGATQHVISMNGVSAQDGVYPLTGVALMHGPYGLSSHQHQRSNSGSSAYESVAKGPVESRGGSFSVLEEGRELQAGDFAQTGTVAAGTLAAAAAGAGAGADEENQQQQLQVRHRHHRVSSGGGSSGSPMSARARQLQRIPSPNPACRSAAAAATAAAAAAGGAAGVFVDNSSNHGVVRGTGSRVGAWQQQQQQQHPLIAHEHVRATSPPTLNVSGQWSSHGRSESRSSSSSIRDLLSGAVPLDGYGHVQRQGLTPTSSGNAAAAAAALQQQLQQQRVPVIQEVPSLTAVEAALLAPSGSSSTAAGRQAMHRRGDSQHSNSSSSSYDTVVCHSPRSSDPENCSVGQVAAAASAAAFLPTGSVTSRAQVARKSAGAVTAAAAAVGASAVADTEVPAAPIAVGAAVDGEEALSGSRTGSWSKKEAHRRLPALDFTTAAPALWLAQDREQQQQQEQGPHDGGVSGTSPPAAAAAGCVAAARAVGRAPVRRHITLDGSSEELMGADAMPQQQQLMLQQELLLTHGMAPQQPQQQQQQQDHLQLPSIEAVAAMLRPSPELNGDEQQQQQQQFQGQMQGMRDIATLEAEQQQQQQRGTRQRPAYSVLLPPPEQHELLLKQQQQQLQMLLQQTHEDDQQQQQQVWQPHQRQWSTSSIPLAHSVSSGGNSPGGAFLCQQQHHHHSFSTPDVAAGGSAYGGGASPHGVGLSTPSKYAGAASGVPRASFGSITRAVSAGGAGAPFQLQQGSGGGFVFPRSYSVSSVGGGVRFAGSSSANGDDDSSPGDGGGSFSSRSCAPGAAAAAAVGAQGAYGGAPSSGAGGSVASSVFTTPHATPQGSPAPLRSGRVTPSYGGLNLAGCSSGGGGLAGNAVSSSCSQLPPPMHNCSGLTASSSYSGSANAPGFGAGLSNLLLPGAAGTPRSVLSPLGREDVLPLQGVNSGYGLLNSASGNGAGAQGSGFGLLNPTSLTPQGVVAPAIPPIPEMPLGCGSAAAAAAAAAGSSLSHHHQQQQQDVSQSPLERRRSGGYRSSMRKGLVAYDQYKHRQRYQDAATQLLDPGSEVARRYRSRMPAI